MKKEYFENETNSRKSYILGVILYIMLCGKVAFVILFSKDRHYC